MTYPAPTPFDGILATTIRANISALLRALPLGKRNTLAEQNIRVTLHDPAGWAQFRRGCVFNGCYPDAALEEARLIIALYNTAHGGDALPVIDRLSVFVAEVEGVERDASYCAASIRNLALRNSIPDADTLPIVTLANMWCIRHDLGHIDPLCITA
jgi:hypothetical protein